MSVLTRTWELSSIGRRLLSGKRQKSYKNWSEVPQVLIKKMLYMHLFEECSEYKKEGLQLKVKRNAEYDDILRLFTSIPVYPLWPLSTFHADSYYAQDMEFINFLQLNTWGHLDEIDIPYHSCTDKILKYELKGKTIKIPNSYFFPQVCFVELCREAVTWPFYIHTVTSTSSTLWPKSQEDYKKEWKAFWTPKGLNWKTWKHFSRQKGLQGAVTLFNLLDQNIVDLFTDEGFADILLFT